MTGRLTLDLEPRAWGGKREGAGRKRDRMRSDPSHAKQPVDAFDDPRRDLVGRTVEHVPPAADVGAAQPSAPAPRRGPRPCSVWRVASRSGSTVRSAGE